MNISKITTRTSITLKNMIFKDLLTFNKIHNNKNEKSLNRRVRTLAPDGSGSRDATRAEGRAGGGRVGGGGGRHVRWARRGHHGHTRGTRMPSDSTFTRDPNTLRQQV